MMNDDFEYDEEMENMSEGSSESGRSDFTSANVNVSQEIKSGSVLLKTCDDVFKEFKVTLTTKELIAFRIVDSVPDAPVLSIHMRGIKVKKAMV